VLLDRKKYADFLMVDHNLWGLKLHCDRAFILEDGLIEEYDNLDEAVAIHTERLLAGTGPDPGIPSDPAL
jgi:ABC-type polysaccharide/polyol phosphate transport system ATPase subunit